MNQQVSAVGRLVPLHAGQQAVRSLQAGFDSAAQQRAARFEAAARTLDAARTDLPHRVGNLIDQLFATAAPSTDPGGTRAILGELARALHAEAGARGSAPGRRHAAPVVRAVGRRRTSGHGNGSTIRGFESWKRRPAAAAFGRTSATVPSSVLVSPLPKRIASRSKAEGPDQNARVPIGPMPHDGGRS